jgi:hypothetical protein
MPSAVRESDQVDDDSFSRKVGESLTLDRDQSLDSDLIPSHPLGVKPLGNLYLHDGPNARRAIGLWNAFPDEILMIILEHFDKSSLVNLGSTCKFFFAFCYSEELWKALFLQ